MITFAPCQRRISPTITDLHARRAGLAPAACVLDQAEALQRQQLPSGESASIAVGDEVRYTLTGELGRVVRLVPGPVLRAVIQFPSGQLIAWAASIPEAPALEAVS